MTPPATKQNILFIYSFNSVILLRQFTKLHKSDMVIHVTVFVLENY